jgi:serine protease AprX
MVRYKCLLLVWLLFLSGSLSAQNRYAVHFKFKPQAGFSLEKPQDFLSAPAVERRFRYQIPLDSLDLPVSNKYINGIEPLVSSILYHSNWLNASVVVAHVDSIALLEALDFVEKVVYVAPGFYPQNRIIDAQRHRKFSTYDNENAVIGRIENQANFLFQNELLDIPTMHSEGFLGKGMRIAVFDAGFPGVNTIPALSHLLNNGQIIGTKDWVQPWNENVYSKHQHGTNVLSLMASNNRDILIGGAPEASYILCITEDVATEYRIEEYNWVKAAEYSDSLGVDIINSSLGYWDFDDRSMDYRIQDLNGQSSIITKGATIAAEKGILIVTSAGNYGDRGASSITMPSDAKGILSIGAINQNLSRASFSSQGPTADGRVKPELTTLGSQVWLLRSNGTGGRNNGTSFSAPQIAAMAAGLWQAKPTWTKDELIQNLLASATQTEKPDNEFGHGVPNFSLAYFGRILSVSREQSTRTVYPNPVAGEVLFVEFDAVLEIAIQWVDTQGRILHRSEVKRDRINEPFACPVPRINPGIYIVQVQAGQEVFLRKMVKQ